MQRDQPHALVVDPVVVEPWQQLAPVQAARQSGVPGARVGFELARVAAQGARRHAHAQAVGQQHGALARALDQALERGQRLAQAIAPDTDVNARPEQFNEFLARVHAVGPQGQARQQGGHRAGTAGVWAGKLVHGGGSF